MRNLLFLELVFTTAAVFGQGNLVYDQQSAASGIGSGGTRIQAFAPLGQSFTPSAALVGFAQFQFEDSVLNNNIGSTVFVNLREDSMTGNLLASTTPVFMQSNFTGTTNFFFAGNVSVTPGVEYFFELVLQSGDDTYARSDVYNYIGGAYYFSGQANNTLDLWFREGYVVPEPSTLVFGLLGGFIFLSRWRRG